MLRPRRLLLFCPLLLTLFFVVLGWRNWHLPTGSEPVWNAMPAPYTTMRTIPFCMAIGAVRVGTATVVGIQNDNSTPKPVPPALLQAWQAALPDIKLVNASSSNRHFDAFLLMGRPDFNGNFKVRCRLFYALCVSPQAGFIVASQAFYFRRSPLSLQTPPWQLQHIGQSSGRSRRTLVGLSTIPDMP